MKRVALISYDYLNARSFIDSIGDILNNDKNKNVNIQYQANVLNNAMQHSALITWEDEVEN